jgi:hypothetical protein
MAETTEPKIARTEALYFDHNGHALDSADGADEIIIKQYDKDGNLVKTTYGHPGDQPAATQE